MALKMNFHILSGKDPFVGFAEASILMNCKIQTLCLKTNIRVIFTPPKVMDEDCLKILYYHHEDFTMCQRLVEIRMNEGNEDSSKQLEPDFSDYIQKIVSQLSIIYYVIYGYEYSQCIYEVEFYASLSMLQKFEMFFEKITHDSSIAFVWQRNANFVPIFVKALLRHLGRKPPIDAKYDSDIVQTWLSDNEPRKDIIVHSSTLNNMKPECIICLYSVHEQMFATRNAKSRYSHIFLPTPSRYELRTMTYLSSEKNKQSDEAYSRYRNKMENYLSKNN